VTTFTNRKDILLNSMTEADFQQWIKDLCDRLRLKYYHTHDSRRSTKGFPDCVIVGPGQVVYAELKTLRGRVTEEQQGWLNALLRAGQFVYLWRPSDMEEIEIILKRLAKGTL
jgi:hypothetical protein